MRASKLRRGLLTLLAVVLALAWAFPVYWMVNSAFLDKVTLQSTKPDLPALRRVARQLHDRAR